MSIAIPEKTDLQKNQEKSGFKPDWSIFFDNPIILKQARVRLKRSSLITWLMMIFVICSALLWMEFEFGNQRYDRSAGYILGGMVFLMLIVGTQQIGIMISTTRATGMIDFHRLSPQSPLSLFVGFILGGTIREYIFILFAIPFLVLACILYEISLIGLAILLFSLLILSLLFHSLTVVSAMLVKTPNANAAKGAAWGVFAALGMLGPLLSGTMAINRAANEPPPVNFFGFRGNLFLVFIFVGIVALVFICIAGVRRMADDNRPSLTKKQAVIAYFFAILAGIALMINQNFYDDDLIKPAEFGVTCIWGLISFLLLATASPERVAYIGGLRRAIRLGLRRPGNWSDRALNRGVLLIFAALLMLGTNLLHFIRSDKYSSVTPLPSASLATAVLIMIQFGLALQYFRLRLGKFANGALIGFLFIVWVLPFMLGISVMIGSPDDDAEKIGQLIMSISPIPGMAIGGNIFDNASQITNEIAKQCQLAALLPTLTCVFIFNMMITNLQRRIDKRILPEHRQPDTDPFAYLDDISARELVAKRSKTSETINKK
jgi:uncharacterized membrane protein